jgi:FKBP-type peptidyl-prolyl cis-trans isomerase
MKINYFVLIIAVLFTVSFYSCNNEAGKSTNNVKIETEADTIAYALGNSMGNSLITQFPDLDPAIIAQALEDVYNETENDLFEGPQESNAAIRTYLQKKSERQGAENLKKSQEFLLENAKREEVKMTDSGLQYEVIEEGNGPKPTAEDRVRVHYHGTTIDGEVFDSSVDRGEPAEFPLNGVIKGWTEGIQLMQVGSKYKFYIPSELAYGERGSQGTIEPNSALIFEVELLEIVDDKE